MAVHSLTVKQIISRIRENFPGAPEQYIMTLINDALVQVGMYSTKSLQARISTVSGQMWYDIGDGANDSSGNKLEANKIHRVDLLDNESDYIRIPRIVDENILVMDSFQDTGKVLSFTPDTNTEITTSGAGGTANTYTATWTASQTHADVSPHSTSGSGANTIRVTITTNSSGHPKLTAITTASSGYKVGDLVTFVSPGNGEKATWTVNEVRYDYESSIERPD